MLAWTLKQSTRPSLQRAEITDIFQKAKGFRWERKIYPMLDAPSVSSTTLLPLDNLKRQSP